VYLAVLLDEDVVQNVVGHAVVALLHDGGVGQRLVVRHVQALVLKVEAVAHPAAVQPLVGEQPLQILQNAVVVLLVQVLRRGLRVVVAKLDGDAVGQEALHVVHQLCRRIVLIQHAVDPGGTGDPSQHLVGALLHIVLQVAGDIHAGDLVLIPLREGQHRVERGVGLGGERGVDIDLVGGRDGVQHPLQGVQIRQRLTAGEHEIAPGGDAVHDADALQNLLQAEPGAVRVFFFVDAERAVVLTVVGDEYRHSSAALPRFIGMSHVVGNLSCKCTQNIVYQNARESKENLPFFPVNLSVWHKKRGTRHPPRPPKAVEKACHCEPVRRLAWQSISKMHNLCVFMQIFG